MKAPSSRVAFCPHCGNQAPQRELHSYTYKTVWYGEDGKPDREGPQMEAILCSCSTCHEPLLYNGIERAEYGEWPALAHPDAGDLHRAVPDAIRDIYGEAFAIKPKAPRGYAILIRSAIEGICDERGVSKGNLQQRLIKLAEAGFVPPTLAKMTDVLRTLGNAAAHDSVKKVTVPMTWAIDEFFRAIIEYVYVAPAKLEAFQSALTKAAVKSDSTDSE
jgi:hypothetical protein